MTHNPVTIFTKPWRCSIEELAEKLKGFGVDGLELPVRNGYPVNPENMATALPEAARTFEQYGLKIHSAATDLSEASIAACGAAGVPIIRLCERIDMKIGYRASVDAVKKRYEEALPALERHGVTVGLQNHCDNFVGSAVGMMEIVGAFDPRFVGAVLDVAHCGLDGEPEAMAVDIAWSHLCMVNLKNAFRVRTNGPESEEAKWRVYWTSGRHGFTSWRKTIEALARRGYEGPLCLPAEYSNPDGPGDLQGDAVDRVALEDIAYVRELTSSVPRE